MRCWLIEPRDPLIARDGRTADNLRFATTRFPYPSVLAGAARTRMASVDGVFSIPPDQKKKLAALKCIPVHGPLLAELDVADGGVRQWLAATPRDAVLVKVRKGEDARVVRHRLQPAPLQDGQRTDSLAEHGLMPVSAPGPVFEKPLAEAPAFWGWEHFARWLRDPGGRGEPEEVAVEELGAPDFPQEQREHLAIEPGERVGVDGRLFLTSGLRMLQAAPRRRSGFTLPPRRFALSLRTPGGRVGDRHLDLREETAPLGGERRLARWSPAGREWPELPEEVREAVVRTRCARIVLLTPAFFAHGALPSWSGRSWRTVPAVTVTVCAACVGRPEVASGWSLAARQRTGGRGLPKPSRRLAGAGSVYFVKIDGGTERDVARWCDAVWLAPVNDREKDPRGLPSPQPDRDGFGLAALGIWEPPAGW